MKAKQLLFDERDDTAIKRQAQKILFYASIICMGLLSVSILFMPGALNAMMNGNRLPTFLAGGLFWFSLISGWTGYGYLSWRQRKKQPSVHTQGRMRSALCVDILTAAALVAFISSLIATGFQGFVCFVTLALFLLGLQMHFVLSGSVYQEIFNKKRGCFEDETK